METGSCSVFMSIMSSRALRSTMRPGITGWRKMEAPEAQLLQQDGMLGIYRAIHTLPEPYREVFLLRATAELRFSEIGAIFGKSENWARVSYYRARQKLSERMSDDEL